VVFILVDDLGWRDVGCYGSTFYETPQIDRLSREGARFTQAYAACPVCSPTRASILTGRYPARVGVTDYIGAAQPAAWNRNTRLLPAPYRPQLQLDEVTLAEALKEAGYATFFAGKWHLGPVGHWPEDQGFDENQGGTSRGGPYGGKQYFSPYGNPRLKDGPPGEHLPDRLATETARFIRQHRDRPFFACLWFYSVHTPLQAREDLRQKYAQKARSVPQDGPAWGQEGDRKVRLVQNHAVYAGMVEAMDQAVGKVLRELDELDLARDTIVVLTSDNGGLSTSEGWPTSNVPLRAGKGWLYEGGVRVALLVRWPASIPGGTVCDAVVTSPDFFPTILEWTGQPARHARHLDGKSFAPALRDPDVPRGAVYWHYPHYGNQGGSPGGAIRDGDWKLIERYEDGSLELYNLRDDLSERQNLAPSEPERVQALLARLRSWRSDVGAKMPTPNPKYGVPAVGRPAG